MPPRQGSVGAVENTDLLSQWINACARVRLYAREVYFGPPLITIRGPTATPDAAGAVFLTLKMLCPWISDWTCWKKYKSDDEEKMLLRVLCTYRINSPHALVKMISTFCDSYDEMLDLIVLGQALKNPRSSVTLN